MKKITKDILIAAGITGLIYFLKRNPKIMEEVKAGAKNCLNDIKEKMGKKPNASS